jgi:hypothetical protein
MASSLEPTVKDAINGQIDKEAEQCLQKMKDGTPVRTGALKASIRKKKVDKPRKYGWSIDYEGYDEHGQPYSEIARTLNKGGKDNNYEATHHIDAAVHELKGMDARIVTAVDEALAKQQEGK